MAMAGWRWSSLEGREEEVFFFFFSFFFFFVFSFIWVFFSRSDKRFCFFIKIFFFWLLDRIGHRDGVRRAGVSDTEAGQSGTPWTDGSVAGRGMDGWDFVGGCP